MKQRFKEGDKVRVIGGDYADNTAALGKIATILGYDNIDDEYELEFEDYNPIAPYYPESSLAPAVDPLHILKLIYHAEV